MRKKKGVIMTLNKELWTKEDYQEFIQYLKENTDPTYKDFHQSLVPNIEEFLGCRVPFLKKTGKEIAKGDIDSFLAYNKHHYYEENMIHGIVIGTKKMDFNTRLSYIRDFIPYVHNWAVCDCFCANCKDFKKNLERGFLFIQELLSIDDPYTIRVALVLLLDYYVEPSYLPKIFKILNQIKKDHYYVKMAMAWLLSICYIKYPKETLPFIKQNKLEPWTHNKAISKIRESYRVPKEQKQELLKYKK